MAGNGQGQPVWPVLASKADILWASLWVFVAMVRDASDLGCRQLAGLWLLPPHCMGVCMICLHALKLAIQFCLAQREVILSKLHILFLIAF